MTKEKIHTIIFEADTRAGKVFDIILFISIIMSVFLVIIESIPSLSLFVKLSFYKLEWFFTIIFTIEYLLRIYVLEKKWRYIFSFYGIVDFLSVIPTYLSLLFVGVNALLIIRSIRLLRVFRVLKLTRYIKESRLLINAIRASGRKILIFLILIFILTIILGTIMYIIEGEKSGFSSIPQSMYWAIVTLTTVGYGDIYPVTWLGQFVASVVMVFGYAIIAVPTGIITVSLSQEILNSSNTQACQGCGKEGHRDGAEYCFSCGYRL